MDKKLVAAELVRLAKSLVGAHGFIDDIDWTKVSFPEDMTWVYNFTDGGWNYEMAKSKKEAVAIANRRWKGSMKIDESSFHIPTEREFRLLNVD